MKYGLAISVLLSLEGESAQRFSEDDVLDAIDTILGMETINAVPKDALLNALRWIWDKCVEEEEQEDMG